ncbi:penicillin-binding protein activator [Sessilibacter corallicola]|uniref:penicillin-binding protein activator n=1 Tax=Sessilibacter corallicola TaxID=2904075 RepID=UPI0033401607
MNQQSENGFTFESLKKALKNGKRLVNNFPSTKTITVACACVLLASCGSSNNKQQPAITTPQAQTVEDVSTLLERARFAEFQGSLADAENLRLEAAQSMLSLGNRAAAMNLYAGVKPDLLDIDKLVSYSLEYGELALSTGEYYLANRILNNSRLVLQIISVNPEQELRWRENRANLFATIDEPIKAIREHIAITPLLTDPQQEAANNETLWKVLTQLPESALTHLSVLEKNDLLRGWYALAAINKNNNYTLEQQLQQVSIWQEQWPYHPANQNLPEDLRLLQQLVSQQPKQIALLLPTTGRFANAGKAVRDGFMASYFADTQSGNTTAELRIYNTDGADINAVYDQAVADGAEAIIGPLQKKPLEELNLRPGLPVPTLALNYVSGSLFTQNLYQFGLAAEDEGRQIAIRAWKDGHRRAMILASSRDWGQRASRAFIDQWQSLGGTIAIDSEFSTQAKFSDTVESSLLVNRSKQRARTLRRAISTSVEFEPRSRSDVDMIFMVANPGDAKQLKPTLAFHYAGAIPVYGTSHLYNPTAGSENKDLNGIRFTSLPWYFGFNTKLKTDLDQTTNTSSFQSLHALGVDAYRVYPRLKQFELVSDIRLYGATGNLYLTDGGRIAREQSWAIINSGEAKALPTVASGILSRAD